MNEDFSWLDIVLIVVGIVVFFSLFVGLGIVLIKSYIDVLI